MESFTLWAFILLLCCCIGQKLLLAKMQLSPYFQLKSHNKLLEEPINFLIQRSCAGSWWRAGGALVSRQRRRQLVSSHSPETLQRQVKTCEVLAASDTVGQMCRLGLAAEWTWCFSSFFLEFLKLRCSSFSLTVYWCLQPPLGLSSAVVGAVHPQEHTDLCQRHS